MTLLTSLTTSLSCRRGLHVLERLVAADALVLHVGQEVADRFAVHGARRRAEHLVERLRELVIAADAVDDLALRVHVVDDPRALQLLRVGGQHHHAVLGVVDRHPRAALEEFAVQVLEELERLDAIVLERLVRHVEIGRQRLADRARLHVVLVDQDRLDVEVLAPRRTRRELELLGGGHRVRHQGVVFALDRHHRPLALAQRDRQRFGRAARRLPPSPAGTARPTAC